MRAAPAFALTVKATVPLPEPALDVWIHESPVAADQLHHEPEVTEKLPEVPEAPNVPLDVGLIE